MSKREVSTKESCCPITNSPREKLASDAETDAIKANFPPGVARPALRALVAASFSSLEQLTKITQEELSQLHGMGPNAVRKLRDGLLAKGQDFRKQAASNASAQRNK